MAKTETEILGMVQCDCGAQFEVERSETQLTAGGYPAIFADDSGVQFHIPHVAPNRWECDRTLFTFWR